MSNVKSKNTAKWIVPSAVDRERSDAIASALGLSPAMGRLLYSRGCRTPEEANSFIRMENGCLYDPFLLPDMKEAVSVISEAVAEHKRIVIYGDYDADGVTSVSVLYLYLSELGANVGYFIPRRADGYGMNVDAVSALASDGASLIITVDTGITANAEIDLARSLGVDVVVTDHHECIDVLPRARAVVNPQRKDSEYPFSGLAGVGVTYKLVCALESERRGGDIAAAALDIGERFMDLVAIGTVADVMPVLDENRIIVSYGLKRLEKTNRPGIRALIDAAVSGDVPGGKPKKQKYTAGFISFTLAPRINAAGRMGDASLAAELFLSNDEKTAKELAEKLCDVNRDRQQLENEIAAQAFDEIEKNHDFEHDPVIVVSADNWHSGIIGIVASRVTERYGRPSILITCEGGDGTIGKGSGRGVRGINLALALNKCGDCLIKCGGHELAAGLTLKASMIDTFRERINEIARESLGGEDITRTVEIDDTLSAEEITLELADEMRLLEPYGVGNPTPVFLTEKMRVLGVVGVGSNKHTRLTLAVGNRNGKGVATFSAMYFSISPDQSGVNVGDDVDVLYNLEANEFRGVRTAQLVVRAIRKSEPTNESAGEDDVVKDGEDDGVYFLLRAGKAVLGASEYYKYIPERAEMASLYRAIRNEIGCGRCVFTLPETAALTCGMSCVKVRLSLDIFSELDILRISENAPGVYTFGMPPSMKKVDLESSAILSTLRRQYKK